MTNKKYIHNYYIITLTSRQQIFDDLFLVLLIFRAEKIVFGELFSCNMKIAIYRGCGGDAFGELFEKSSPNPSKTFWQLKVKMHKGNVAFLHGVVRSGLKVFCGARACKAGLLRILRSKFVYFPKKATRRRH